MRLRGFLHRCLGAMVSRCEISREIGESDQTPLRLEARSLGANGVEVVAQNDQNVHIACGIWLVPHILLFDSQICL